MRQIKQEAFFTGTSAQGGKARSGNGSFRDTNGRSSRVRRYFSALAEALGSGRDVIESTLPPNSRRLNHHAEGAGRVPRSRSRFGTVLALLAAVSVIALWAQLAQAQVLGTPPTVTITGVPKITRNAFTVTFTFSEAVSGFETSDIHTSKLAVTNLSPTSGLGTSFTVTFDPWSSLAPPRHGSLMWFRLPAATVIPSNAKSAQHNIRNGKRYTLTISGVPATINGPFTATFTFDSTLLGDTFGVSGFTADDITVTNATLLDFTSTAGNEYTALITPTTAGTVTISVPKDAVDLNSGHGGHSLDWGNQAASKSGEYTGTDDLIPTLTGTIADQALTQGTAYTSAAAFPAATGGNTPITYSVANLPSGITLNSTSTDTNYRKLTGTATAPLAKTSLTYKATDSDASDPDSATLTFNLSVKPKKPAGFTATGGVGKVDLAWTALARVSGWEYKRDSGSWTAIANSGVSINSHTVTDLASSTAYTFKVRAFVGDGSATPSTRVDGVESDAKSATTSAADLVPVLTDVADQLFVQGTAVDVELPAATGGNGHPNYDYTLTPDVSNGLTFTASTHKLTGTPSTPKAKVTYTYTATEKSDPDNTNESASKTFTIGIQPQKPANFTATAGNKKVTLSWTAIAGVSGWEMMRDSGTWTAIAGSDDATASHTVTGLTNGTEYTFSVRAFVGTGDSRVASVESDTKSATPRNGGGGGGGGGGGDTPIGNRAPVVADGGIPDGTVKAGVTAEVSLSGVFSDPDGDSPLVFEASSGDTGLVEVTVEGSALKISGIREGEAVITVTARDGDGAEVSDRFTMKVEAAEECAVDDQSLEEFVECAAQSLADSDAFGETLGLLEKFRDSEGNWNDGYVYLVLLTERGGVYFHADRREVEDLDWSGILLCEEEGGSVLEREGGCFIEYEGERSGYAHRFSASHVPLAHGEEKFVLLGGFDKTPEGKSFTGVIGVPSTEAGDVDTDDELRGFVEDAGKAFGEAVENPEIDPAELRGILRREGPWRDGDDVYVYVMDETGRVIFDGADRSGEQEYGERYKDIIAGAGEGIVEYAEGRRGYALRVEVPLDDEEASRVYVVGSGYRVEEEPGGSGGGCAVGASGSGGASGLFLAAFALFLTVLLGMQKRIDNTGRRCRTGYSSISFGGS